MKKTAKFICVNSSNYSIFECENRKRYAYAGQFRTRVCGDMATIVVNEYDRVESVQFHA